MKITVIGDLILDKNIYTDQKQNKEGAFYCGDEDEQHYFAGGAGLVASNLAELGHDVTLLTSHDISKFKKKILFDTDSNNRIKLVNVAPENDAMPCIKNRVIDVDTNNTIARFDYDEITIPGKFNSKYWKDADYIVIADYDKGVITKDLIDRLPKEKLFVDTKPCHMDWFKGVNFLKCNKKEFIEYTGDKIINPGKVESIAEKLGVWCLCVTLGSEGAMFGGIVIDDAFDNWVKPVFTGYASNVCGAGDLFLSIIVDRQNPLCGGYKSAICDAVYICSQRVQSNERCRAYRRDGTINDLVAVSGCFDGLHPGHIELLERAKHMGNKVVVFLNTDNYIRKTKGREPLYSMLDREKMLLATKYVDYVLYIDDDKHLEEWLGVLKPYYRVLGEEYKDKEVIGKKYSKVIRFIPNYKDFSTTKLIEGIKQSS